MSGSKTAVGHTKADDTDVYVGRGSNGRHLLSVAEPGQRGWLGNPFTLDEYSREESVAKYREAFEDKLHRDDAFRAAVADPACAACGTTEDVHICPGEQLDDFQWRCDDCRRFPQWFWQPGDHPSLLVRDWIETCDRCDAEFTTVFGVTFWYDTRSGHHTQDLCLRCVNPENVRRELEDDR